jgi:hypothetical protein
LVTQGQTFGNEHSSPAKVVCGYFSSTKTDKMLPGTLRRTKPIVVTKILRQAKFHPSLTGSRFFPDIDGRFPFNCHIVTPRQTDHVVKNIAGRLPKNPDNTIAYILGHPETPTALPSKARRKYSLVKPPDKTVLEDGHRIPKKTHHTNRKYP